MLHTQMQGVAGVMVLQDGHLSLTFAIYSIDTEFIPHIVSWSPSMGPLQRLVQSLQGRCGSSCPSQFWTTLMDSSSIPLITAIPTVSSVALTPSHSQHDQALHSLRLDCPHLQCVFMPWHAAHLTDMSTVLTFNTEVCCMFQDGSPLARTDFRLSSHLSGTAAGHLARCSSSLYLPLSPYTTVDA